MTSPRKTRRKAEVSFLMFRRLQLMAVQTLWVNLYDHDSSANQLALFYAHGLICALQEGRFADAVELSRRVAEQQYGDAGSFRLATQIVALVKKVPFRDGSLDPERAAFQKFLEAEEHCRATAEVLRPLRFLLNGNFSGEIEPESAGVVNLLVRAKRHLLRVLGRKPPIRKMMEGARFGSGAAVGVHGNATHLLRKLSSSKWTVSRAAMPYAFIASVMNPAFWYALDLDPTGFEPLWRDEYAFLRVNGCLAAPWQSSLLLAEFRRRWNDRVEVCDTDTITYVPKDADCHRTVGTQPVLNGYVQLGIGDFLSQTVLRERCGIDLTTGQDAVNGPLAALGSFCDGTTLCTIDLKSASDTIARELIRLLFPEEWFMLLNATATPGYIAPGDQSRSPVRYQKLCAMGNGFCFPVETLVFWSLVQAVYDVVDVPDRLSAVYGDDIIVYQPAALLLIELLDAVGFDTNVNKTFVHGPFRESCGQDYFNGINVRPAVLDEIVEGFGQVYHLINSLQRKGYTSLAERMRAVLGPDVHKRPFPGDTTTALEVPWDEFMASRHARFHGKPPSDLRRPFYHCWSWTELLSTAVQDEEGYEDKYHLSAALSGATGVKGVPTFAYRRTTKVRVRRIAHG